MKWTRLLYGALGALLVAGCAEQPKVRGLSNVTLTFYAEPNFHHFLCQVSIPTFFIIDGRFWQSGKFGEQNLPQCTNDMASSAQVSPALTGLRVLIYDKPECGAGTYDDWLDARVLSGHDTLQLYNFEFDQNDAWNRIEYHHFNGLNRKVSCFVIRIQ